MATQTQQAEATVVHLLHRDSRLCCNYQPGPQLGSQMQRTIRFQLIKPPPKQSPLSSKQDTDKSTCPN